MEKENQKNTELVNKVVEDEVESGDKCESPFWNFVFLFFSFFLRSPCLAFSYFPLLYAINFQGESTHTLLYTSTHTKKEVPATKQNIFHWYGFELMVRHSLPPPG